MKFLLFLPIYYMLSCICIPFVTTLFIPVSQAEPPDENSTDIEVFSPSDNSVSSMPINQYLIGVVSAEMPAAFELEALKAQAVAARTYALYKSASDDHLGDVCTDFSHCQAYLSEEEMKRNWGDDYNIYLNKITSAVLSTENEILTYNNEPIMAVFHSMGGGATENSSDVWGTQLPYLTSVPSPGEETAVNYQTQNTFSFDEFKEKILNEYPNIQLNSFLDVSQPVLTQGGHVKNIFIGSQSISGTKIRSIFNLRSTKFDISFSENTVTFSVTGYGHGVGMSQYGANAMAKEGKTYKEILSHYYKGSSLSE